MEEQNGKRLRGLGIRVLLLVLALPPAFLATELFTWRFRGAGQARRDVVETSYMPTRLRANFEDSVMGLPFETNQYGFRGEPNFPRTPPAGEARILALGDSVGVGLGIRAADHYVKLAEKRLNDGRQRFRVINAAGQGYSPSSYYAYLVHEGLSLDPRMVIVEIELCNDVTDEALLDWEYPDRSSPRPDVVRGGRYVVSWDQNLLGTVARGPYFYEKTYAYTLLLRRALNKAWDLYPRGPFWEDPGVTYFHLGYDRFLLTDGRIEAGWKRLFDGLKQTHTMLDERGIRFLLMILPSRFVFDDSAPLHRDFARRILERAVGMAEERNIPCLEFASEMAAYGGAGLYFDFAHPTEEGNRVIGRKLGDYLLSIREEIASQER